MSYIHSIAQQLIAWEKSPFRKAKASGPSWRQGSNGNFPVRNAVIDTFLTTAAVEYELSQGYYHLPDHVGLKEILLSKNQRTQEISGEKKCKKSWKKWQFCTTGTLPETNMAPENGWLEY